MDKCEIRHLMKAREAAWVADAALGDGSAVASAPASGAAARRDGSDTAREIDRIWAAVESSPQFISAGTVLTYMDIPGEVPTLDFILRWRESKDFVIPRVHGDSLRLFHFDRSHLQQGYKGILEPTDDAIEANPQEIDLALVPGVAFAFMDGKLWRLGRGKGFYDRLLPQLNCPRYGIFQSFRLMDTLPTDPWDQPLDLPGSQH